jgi:hypothetical protein
VWWVSWVCSEETVAAAAIVSVYTERVMMIR